MPSTSLVQQHALRRGTTKLQKLKLVAYVVGVLVAAERYNSAVTRILKALRR
jgi:hypothetical protein